jgi:hypothetical protein
LRLRATIAEFPDGDAELSRLVGQVLLDAGAGEDHHAERQYVEHLIVALEGCCLGVFGPIGFEGDLGHHLAVVGPAGGDTLGGLRANRRAARSRLVIRLGFERSPIRRFHSRCALGPSSGGHSG